jgi:CoA:oxalate CoA-transferase
MLSLVLDRQWASMVQAMGKPELLHDPRFATAADRVTNRDLLNSIMQEWFLSFPSDEVALAVLEQHRIACAPVLSVVETLNHPYFKARNMVRTVPDPILGEVTILGFPLKFSAYPDLPELQAPLLGQHGVQVLKEYLNYADTEIARLQQSGTLYREDR